MRLKWIQHADGSITIRDLPFIAHMRKGEKGLDHDVDAAYITELAAKANERATRLNAKPLALLGHNEFDEKGNIRKAASIIGGGSNVYYDVATKLGRMSSARITQPDQVAKIKRGEQNVISPEFFAKSKVLWGFSFLDGAPNHQFESLPRFELEAKPESEAEPQLAVAASLSTGEQAEFNTFMAAEPLYRGALGQSSESAMPTIEELSALLDKKLAPVNERLNKLEGGKETKPVRLSADPEVDNAVAEARKGDLAELKTLKRGLMIDGYLTQLSAVAGGATARQQKLWREKLTECASDEACTERFERLKLEVSHKSTKLEAEQPFGKVPIESQLADEFKRLGGEEHFNQTEAEYVARWAKNEALTTDLR